MRDRVRFPKIDDRPGHARRPQNNYIKLYVIKKIKVYGKLSRVQLSQFNTSLKINELEETLSSMVADGILEASEIVAKVNGPIRGPVTVYGLAGEA